MVPKRCQEIMQIKIHYTKTTILRCFLQLSGFDEQLKRWMEIAELMVKLDTERKTIEQKLKLYMRDAEIAEIDRYASHGRTARGLPKVCEDHGKQKIFGKAGGMT